MSAEEEASEQEDQKEFVPAVDVDDLVQARNAAESASTTGESAIPVDQEREALLHARAIGAELNFLGQVGRSYRVPEERAEARKAGLRWLETGEGSHLLRTIAEMAYTPTTRSAIQIYRGQLARWRSDQQPAGIDETIRNVVSRYDDNFISLGLAETGAIVDEFGPEDVFSKLPQWQADMEKKKAA